MVNYLKTKYKESFNYNINVGFNYLLLNLQNICTDRKVSRNISLTRR